MSVQKSWGELQKMARASKITMDGRPAVLEFITREEPVLSRFFTPTY